MWNDAPKSGAPQHKTIEFVRIVMQLPDRESIGNTYTDLSCAFNGTPIYVNRSGDWAAHDFQPIFNAEMARAGYSRGANSDSLFGEAATKDEPDLYIAAAITALNVRACTGMRVGLLAGTGASSSAKISVAWQVLEPTEKKIIFRGTSDGQGKVQSDPRTSVMEATRAAFADAARNIIATTDFQRVMIKSPEEQAETEQLSAEPAPAPTYISAVPLSAQPFQERLKNTRAQVVTIRIGSSGSGFYIADGLLMTNHHVAAKGASVKVRFLSGKEVPGLSIASNAKRDVALIRTENVDAVGLPLQVQSPEVGTQTYAVGSPEGQDFEGTVSAGIVSSVREFHHQQFIQSDVAVTHGSSGGPLLDANGNVIGITDLNGDRDDNPTGLNLFIPIAEALQSVGVVVQPPEPAKIAKASTKKKTATP
jgi:S1-C subfamily serine protease